MPPSDADKCHLPTKLWDNGLVIRNTILPYEVTEILERESSLMQHKTLSY